MKKYRCISLFVFSIILVFITFSTAESANDKAVTGIQNAYVYLCTDLGLVQTISEKPTDNQSIYAAGYQFAYSRNGGQTWSGASSGLPNPVNLVALAIDSVSPSYLYASTANELTHAIYRSDNEGIPWVLKDNGIPNDAPVFKFDVIAVHPVTPTIVFAWTEIGAPCAFRAALPLG